MLLLVAAKKAAPPPIEQHPKLDTKLLRCNEAFCCAGRAKQKYALPVDGAQQSHREDMLFLKDALRQHLEQRFYLSFNFYWLVPKGAIIFAEEV